MLRFIPLCLLALGCTSTDTDLEIIGAYTDPFGGTHDITADTWTMSGFGIFHVSSFDNDGDWLIAQNDAANEYSPNLWSRMDWHDASSLWFCQTAYEAASEAEAAATPGADSADPETSGCGGFGWSELTPAP